MFESRQVTSDLSPWCWRYQSLSQGAYQPCNTHYWSSMWQKMLHHQNKSKRCTKTEHVESETHCSADWPSIDPTANPTPPLLAKQKKNMSCSKKHRQLRRNGATQRNVPASKEPVKSVNHLNQATHVNTANPNNRTNMCLSQVKEHCQDHTVVNIHLCPNEKVLWKNIKLYVCQREGQWRTTLNKRDIVHLCSAEFRCFRAKGFRNAIKFNRLITQNSVVTHATFNWFEEKKSIIHGLQDLIPLRRVIQNNGPLSSTSRTQSAIVIHGNGKDGRVLSASKQKANWQMANWQTYIMSWSLVLWTIAQNESEWATITDICFLAHNSLTTNKNADQSRSNDFSTSLNVSWIRFRSIENSKDTSLLLTSTGMTWFGKLRLRLRQTMNKTNTDIICNMSVCI